MARLLDQRFKADHSDYADPGLPCACGQETCTLSVGPVAFGRADYHCMVCRKGLWPRDRAPQMSGMSHSPAVKRRTGLAAAGRSFAATRHLRHERAGLRVPTKQVERTVKEFVRALAVVWTAESRNPEGRPQRDACSVSYAAAIESAASRDTDPEG